MVIYVECGLLYYAYYNAVIFFIFLGIGVCFVFWGWFMGVSFMVYFFLFCWVGLCVVCGYITHTTMQFIFLGSGLCFWFFLGGLGVSE